METGNVRLRKYIEQKLNHIKDFAYRTIPRVSKYRYEELESRHRRVVGDLYNLRISHEGLIRDYHQLREEAYNSNRFPMPDYRADVVFREDHVRFDTTVVDIRLQPVGYCFRIAHAPGPHLADIDSLLSEVMRQGIERELAPQIADTIMVELRRVSEIHNKNKKG